MAFSSEGTISFAPPHPDGLFARILDIKGEEGTYIQLFYDHFKEPFSIHHLSLNRLAAKDFEIRLCIIDCELDLKDKKIQNEDSLYVQKAVQLSCCSKIKIKEFDGRICIKFFKWMEKDVFLQLLDVIPKIQKALERYQQGVAYDKIFQLAPPHPNGLFIKNIFREKEKEWVTYIYYDYYKEPIHMDQKDFIMLLHADNRIKSAIQKRKDFRKQKIPNDDDDDEIIINGPVKRFQITIISPLLDNSHCCLIRLIVRKKQIYYIDAEKLLKVLDCKSKFMETLSTDSEEDVIMISD